MSEERLGQRMRSADVDEAPDPAFVARLYSELASELGHAIPPFPDRQRALAPPAAGRIRGRRWLLLAAAALLVLAVGSLMAGAVIVRLSDAPEPDLLERLQKTGRIRITLSREHPQVLVPGGIMAGFDIDVAEAIASRLGLAAEMLPRAASEVGHVDGSWDLAMATMDELTAAQEAELMLVEPVYAWPRMILVRDDAPLAQASDLAGLAVGAIPQPNGIPLIPPGADARSVASDEECLDLLSTGELDACVSKTLGPADLAARPRLRAIDEATTFEIHAVVLPRSGPDPSSLTREVRRVLDELRADGTLAELSLRRFRADLTVPPPD